MRGDPYEAVDPVFGVRESLLVKTEPADEVVAKQYNVETGSQVLKYDFVLATESEVSKLREEEAKQALADLGHGVQWLNGLPVPDVD